TRLPRLLSVRGRDRPARPARGARPPGRGPLLAAARLPSGGRPADDALEPRAHLPALGDAESRAGTARRQGSAGDAGAVRRPARRAPPYAGGPAPPLPGRGPSGLPDRPAGPADHRAHRIGKPDTVRHRADRPRSRRRMAHRAATFPARAGHRPHLAAHAPLRLPRPGGGEMTEAAVPGARRGGASVPSVGVVIVTRGRRPRL